jgi:hypothetical protein
MPKRVIIIGLLFCLAGGSAIWNVISGFFHSELRWNFGVLMLPVGIGLLRGRQQSQWWARFWIVLGYAGCAFLGLSVFMSHQASRVTLFGNEIRGSNAVICTVLVSLGVAGILIVIHRLLYSPIACEYFKSKSEPNDAASAVSPGC